MKYCYSKEHGRLCNHNCEEHECFNCKKTISDCEWITNSGSCNECFDEYYQAAMVELADTEDLKSSAEKHTGSIPVSGTRIKKI